MATLSGLISGFFTDIDVVDSIAINGDVGTANQVLTSDGTKTSYQNPTTPAVSSLLNAGTGITITSTGNPETIATNVKSLVLSGTAVVSTPQTFNPNANGGSQTITINDTDNQLTLAEGNGIVITDLGGFNRRVATDIDADTIVFNGTEMEVAKVPNALTAGTNISFNTGTTYDGSGAITISATDTNTQLNLTADLPLEIDSSAGGLNKNVELNFDSNTMGAGGGALQVLKVPSVLTSGTNITFVDTSDGSAATTYDGSSGITVSSTDTNTQLNLTEGNGISITNTGGLNRTIAMNADGTTLNSNVGSGQAGVIKVPNVLTAGTGVSFADTSDGASATTYDGSSGITLSVGGGVIATKIQRTSAIRSFTNSYSEYSSDFRTSFVAQSTNVMVEFRAVIRADSKVFYGGLYDYSEGSYNTDTRNRFNFNDESDQDHSVLTWWMRNLTAGQTYYISPYFRGSSSTVYVYAGHSGSTDGFAPGVMRIIDGGSNVDIY